MINPLPNFRNLKNTQTLISGLKTLRRTLCRRQTAIEKNTSCYIGSS